jgi:hypothetical protein
MRFCAENRYLLAGWLRLSMEPGPLLCAFLCWADLLDPPLGSCPLASRESCGGLKVAGPSPETWSEKKPASGLRSGSG